MDTILVILIVLPQKAKSAKNLNKKAFVLGGARR